MKMEAGIFRVAVAKTGKNLVLRVVVPHLAHRILDIKQGDYLLAIVDEKLKTFSFRKIHSKQRKTEMVK